MNLSDESLVLDIHGEHVGRVSGVHIDSDTNQLVDLILRGTDQAQRPVVIVPVSLVAGIVGRAVTLSVTAASCYRPATRAIGGQRAAPPLEEAGQRNRRRELHFGAAVQCLDGQVGSLRRILYDEYGFDVEELVIHVTEKLDYEVGVPIAWVREIHRDRIVLSSTKEDVMTMPLAPDDL